MIEVKSPSTAAGWIKHEKVIAYPTEGVWGLGSLNKKHLIEELNKIKGRDKEKKNISSFSRASNTHLISLKLTTS